MKLRVDQVQCALNKMRAWYIGCACDQCILQLRETEQEDQLRSVTSSNDALLIVRRTTGSQAAGNIPLVVGC